MRLIVSVPKDFDFRRAVCSHGFFVLAPNRWDPVRRRWHTSITLSEDVAVDVCVGEGAGGKLVIQGADRLTARHRAAVRTSVVRMLRLDEDFSGFHARCRESESHRPAAEMRFGRLLRSASLFEDIVKVMCTCNVGWRQTVAMVDRIVSHWGVPVTSGESAVRGFPTPARLAGAGVSGLREKARVGYRGESLHRFAADVAEGRLDLDRLAAHGGPTSELVRELRRIHGVGEYAAGHICMLLGRYDRLAIDSETVRFLTHRHPRRRWTPATVRRYYESWSPYQFLAYWFELWQQYEERHGPADQWSPAVTGAKITLTQ